MMNEGPPAAPWPASPSDDEKTTSPQPSGERGGGDTARARFGARQSAAAAAPGPVVGADPPAEGDADGPDALLLSSSAAQAPPGRSSASARARTAGPKPGEPWVEPLSRASSRTAVVAETFTSAAAL